MTKTYYCYKGLLQRVMIAAVLNVTKEVKFETAGG